MAPTAHQFSSAAADTLSAGTVVAGRYRVVEKLGEGGMGAVYRAVQEPLGREVALKVIAPALARDADAVERFRREAKAASSLSHPHIVTVYDFGADGGLLFLAMELIAGVGLDVIVRRGQTPPARAIAILRGVCAALSEAHARGIIHRDLKTQNIMLTSTSTQQDVVKVVDFGIARLADHAGATLTQTGAVVGTPGYVAPELFDGAAPSAASDLYAVGVVAYELLAGVAPFPGGTPREILKAVLFGEPPPLRAFVRDVPAPLEGLVMGLLEKDPAKRPGSARAVEAALSALQGGVTATASPSPPSSTPLSSSPPPSSPTPVTSVQVFGTETMLPPPSSPDLPPRPTPPPPPPPPAVLAPSSSATPITVAPPPSSSSPSPSSPALPPKKKQAVPGWVIGVGAVVGGLAIGTPVVAIAVADAIGGKVTVGIGPEDVQGLKVLLGPSSSPAVDGVPVPLPPAALEALRTASPAERAELLTEARAALQDPDLGDEERAIAGAVIRLIGGADGAAPITPPPTTTTTTTVTPTPPDAAAIMARAERLLGATGEGAARVDAAALARQGIGTRTNADLRQEAERALVAHDAVRAERALQQLLLQNPDDVEGLRLLANVYASSGRDDEATALRLRFLQLAPTHPTAAAVRLLLSVPGVTD